MMRDADLANRMLIRLSNLLRVTLDNAGNQIVPLRQELDFLRGYLEIEQTRFQDRLTTSFDISPATLDARVPYLILQPLVENALRHGITTRPGAGHIEVRAAVENASLLMQVRDDGVGLDGTFKKGIGLANTEARLNQLYGTAHQFQFNNLPAGGLLVTITIPFDER
jgi:LytS/YehU family sensor histidine kinase